MQVLVGKEFPGKVIPLIEEAKSSIDIVVFDWRWYPENPGSTVQLFNQALLRAKKRGVKVRAILNPLDTIQQLKALGIEAKKVQHKNLVHCKLMLIDGVTAVVGSHNYTASAFQFNLELSVVVNVPAGDLKIANFFNHLWGP